MGWKLIKQDFANWGFCTIEDAIDQWPQFFCRLLQVCPALEKKNLVRANEILDILSKDIDEGKFKHLQFYKILVYLV